MSKGSQGEEVNKNGQVCAPQVFKNRVSGILIFWLETGLSGTKFSQNGQKNWTSSARFFSPNMKEGSPELKKGLKRWVSRARMRSEKGILMVVHSRTAFQSECPPSRVQIDETKNKAYTRAEVHLQFTVTQSVPLSVHMVMLSKFMCSGLITFF